MFWIGGGDILASCCGDTIQVWEPERVDRTLLRFNVPGPGFFSAMAPLHGGTSLMASAEHSLWYTCDSIELQRDSPFSIVYVVTIGSWMFDRVPSRMNGLYPKVAR